ncbi:hypothetical protein EBX31_10125, partial [bacterium]|nr:hypothetical protein [bacterium]
PDTVNRVRVEVGAVEGLLSLESFEVSGGTTTVTDGSVTAITAANDGRVYLSQPTVIIGGGGLVPATASAEVMGGALTAVLIGDEGSGYSNSPTVNITGGGGTGAVVQANVVNGKVVSYTILNPGYGYTSAPTLTVTGPTGTQAAASLGGLTSTGGIASLISTTIGSGYGVSPTVKITDPTGLGASVRAVVNSKGQITPYTVVSGGSGYTGAPAVTITGGGGTGATAQAVVQNGVVVGIIPVNGGSGYTSDVTVTIASPTGGGATAVALNATPSGGSLLSFIVNNSGIGYTNPTITVALPQIQAKANANLQNQQIESFTITNAGGGYASAPKVYIQAAGSDPFNLDKDHVGFFSDRFGIFKDGNGTELVTAGIVGLGPFTNQRPVNLGTETSGATSFLAADLQRFVADTLVLGTRRYLDPAYGAGVITVSQAISANTINLGALVLAGTREVRDLGGTTGIDFSNLVIDAGGEVSFTGFQNRADYLAGVIRDTGLALGASFRFDAALAGNTADGFKPLTISQVVVGAPEFTGRDFYQGIQTEDGNITLHADDIELSRLVGFLDTTAGVTNGTSTATVTLAPLAPGGSRPVNINYDSLSRPNGTPADSGFYGLTSIQVQTPGSKYKSVPTVTISPSTTGATASGTAQMVLGDIDTAAGIGSGYTSIPTVTITGGGAQRQATGVAVVDFDPNHPATFGKVIAVQITDQGLGYQWTDGTTVPTGQTPLTITFSGGGGVTSTTTGSLVVRSVQLSGGASYTSAPTVTLAQPTGTGGTAATAVGLLGALSLRIGNPNQPELENIRAASVVIGANSGGDSYVSSASSVSLNSDFGYNYGLYRKAPRTAVFAADGVIALGLSQIPPSPYPQPATSSIQVPNFSVIAGGAVNLGQYGLATANAFISASGGGVSSINVDYAGQGYTQAPIVTLTSADGNGSGATASATINSAGQISQIVLVNAGTGYTTAP